MKMKRRLQKTVNREEFAKAVRGPWCQGASNYGVNKWRSFKWLGTVYDIRFQWTGQSNFAVPQGAENVWPLTELLT
jgi:hypothetical protein